jgi:sortase (surface protein transpeptidase)
MPDVVTTGGRPARYKRAGPALVATGLLLTVPAAVTAARSVLAGGGDTATAAPVGTRPGAPTRMSVPAIGIDVPVEPLGLRPSGAVDVPRRFDTVGWYVGSAVPGATGPTVLLGHIDSHTGPAVFYRLHALRPGDGVTVARADAAVARFVVDRVGEFPKSHFPTTAVYGPTSRPELRLVTCAGPSHGHYHDNLVVFAHLVG